MSVLIIEVYQYRAGADVVFSVSGKEFQAKVKDHQVVQLHRVTHNPDNWLSISKTTPKFGEISRALLDKMQSLATG